MIKYKQIFECDLCRKSIISSRVNQISILERSEFEDENAKNYSVLKDKKLDFCNTCLNALVNKFISECYEDIDLTKPEKFTQNFFVRFLLEKINSVNK